MWTTSLIGLISCAQLLLHVGASATSATSMNGTLHCQRMCLDKFSESTCLLRRSSTGAGGCLIWTAEGWELQPRGPQNAAKLIKNGSCSSSSVHGRSCMLRRTQRSTMSWPSL